MVYKNKLNMGLTKVLNNRILYHLHLEPDGNTNFKQCYEGFISKNQACYGEIVRYHKEQTGNDRLDAVVRLATPLYIRIHTDNGIMFTLSINDRNLCFLGELDLNAIFKTEIREYNIDYIFG